jgi:hypothetical protein
MIMLEISTIVIVRSNDAGGQIEPSRSAPVA